MTNIAISDRNVSVSVEDLRQRYNLDDIEAVKLALSTTTSSLESTNAELSNFVTQVTEDIGNLQSQVDGTIMTYFYEGEPTLENLPASEWLESEYESHRGDLYYDQLTGYAYRFSFLDDEFLWVRIADTDATLALSIANSAQDTADSKRRIFVTTPTVPYDIGDIWVGDDTTELKRCQTPKTSEQTYSSSDWIKAVKYTDDSTFNIVISKINDSTEIETIDTSKLATITADKIALEGYTTINDGFSVDLNGDMTATNADISGKITSTEGSIGGWDITSTSISKGSTNATAKGMLSGDAIAFYAGSLTPASAPFRVGQNGVLTATNANITGAITATSGSFTGAVYASSGSFSGSISSSSGTIGGWNLSGSYLYNGGIDGSNGARLYNDGRLYMKNNYGWLNTGTGGTIVSGNGSSYPVIIGDAFYTSAGGAGGTVALRAAYGNIRIASNYDVNISGDNIDLGGSSITAMGSYSLSGTVFTGSGGAKMYANANVLLNPTSGYYAYVNDTSSSNRIAVSSSGPSSRNVKTNIKELKDYDNIYKDLQDLKLHTFDYKYEGIKEKKEDFGFIIDEIENLPNISKLTKHYDCEGYIKDNKLIPKREDDEEQKTLTPLQYKEWDRDSYIKMQFVLIKSLQEKLDSLEKEIDKLKEGGQNK